MLRTKQLLWASLLGLALIIQPVRAQSQISNPGIQPTGTIAANDCVKFVNPFLVTSTGAACAGATAPGGSTTQLQYNNASAFGGVSGWTTNGSTALTGGASTTVAIGGATIGSNALAVTGTGNISGALTLGTSGILTGGTNLISQYNSTAANRFQVFNTRTDASNGEWFDIDWITNANVATIGTNKNGTGATRALTLAVGGVGAWQINTAGHLFAVTDDTYDIGQSGSPFNRVRNIYASRSITIGNGFGLIFGARGDIFPSSDGVFTLRNTATTDFGRLQFGGTTSSFPALKRSTTTLAVRLADDSADAPLTAAAITASGAIVTSATTDSTTTTSGALQVAGGAAIRKRVFIDGITTSSGLQTAVLCQSSGGEMIADSVACLASAGHFKNIRGPMPDGALAKIALLPIDLWSYKPEGKFTSDDWTRERIGPIADDVAAMDARLAGYDGNGNVRTYSTEQLLAYTIKALQELKADNDNLRTEVRRIAR